LKTVVLIPALNPNGHLLRTIEGCMALGLERILVVDDGSGEEYRAVFDQAQALGAQVLRHQVNRGKGAALKTGIRGAEERWPDTDGVVTADADGQHAPEDILRVARGLEGGADLVLGVRDFSGPEVPRKSRMGNAFSAAFFRLTTGVRCGDTQTGLRGIPGRMFAFALETPGERYDFEMNLLMETAKSRRRIEMLPIRTIYLDQNSASHFRVVRDSLLIYRRTIRYLLVAGGSCALDLGLFALLTATVFPTDRAGISWATVIARCASGLFNFKANQMWCFQVKKRTAAQAGKYLALFLCVMLASSQIVALLRRLPLPLTLTKAVVDVALFFFNYQIQSRWIFADRDRGKNESKD